MKNLIQSITRAAAAMLLLFSTPALAQVPDLTNGGVPTDSYYINLGPTGLAVWVHSAKVNGFEGETTNARQFLVRTVDAGSPAYGILAANDVILGADGTGAVPGNFTYDARQAFAAAINDAEARSPATLKVLRWRANPHFPALRPDPLALSGASRRKQTPSSSILIGNASSSSKRSIPWHQHGSSP